jgi:hypothetical protein
MRTCRNVILVVCCFAFCAFGQDSPITKDAIIQMVKAGLPEEVIVSKIKSNANPPNLSTDDLIALKGAGASDGVLRALVSVEAKTDTTAAGGSPTLAAVDPNNPMAPHDPGIYMMVTDRDGGKKMVLIDRASTGAAKTSNVWGYAFSYGISKAKVKAEIPGPRSATRSTEVKPVVYMYFPPTGNLGAADTITSPSQFALLALEKKKDHRETTVMKMGLGSASSGTDQQKSVGFDAEKIRPYAYKVIPKSNLEAGEYAFIASTGTAQSGSVAVYDFGVDLQ